MLTYLYVRCALGQDIRSYSAKFSAFKTTNGLMIKHPLLSVQNFLLLRQQMSGGFRIFPIFTKCLIPSPRCVKLSSYWRTV